MTTAEELRSKIILIDPVDEREKSSIVQTLERLTWDGDLFD